MKMEDAKHPIAEQNHTTGKYLIANRMNQCGVSVIHRSQEYSPGVQHINHQAFQFPDKTEPEPPSPHIQNIEYHSHLTPEQRSPCLQTNVNFQKMFGAAGTVQESQGINNASYDHSPHVKTVNFFGTSNQQQQPANYVQHGGYGSAQQSPMQSPMQSPHITSVNFQKAFIQQPCEQMPDEVSPHNSGTYQPGFFNNRSSNPSPSSSQHFPAPVAPANHTYNTSYSTNDQNHTVNSFPSATYSTQRRPLNLHEQNLDMVSLTQERPFSVGSVPSNLDELERNLFELDGSEPGANRSEGKDIRNTASPAKVKKPEAAQDVKQDRKKPKAKGKTLKMVSSNGTKIVQCAQCNKQFNNSSALAKHKLTHSDERKYQCNICRKAFKRQDHLNGHMMTHRDKKPFECKIEGCDKSYCDARSLRRHLENQHNTPAKDPFSLDMIGTEGSPSQATDSKPGTPTSPNPGSRQWGAARALSCQVCGKKFKNLPALNGHMRLHGGYILRKDDDSSNDSVPTAAKPSVRQKTVRRPRKPRAPLEDATDGRLSANKGLVAVIQQNRSRSAEALVNGEEFTESRLSPPVAEQPLNSAFDDLNDLLSTSHMSSVPQAPKQEPGSIDRRMMTMQMLNTQQPALMSLNSLESAQNIVDNSCLSDPLQTFMPGLSPPEAVAGAMNDAYSAADETDPLGIQTNDINSLTNDTMRDPLIGSRDPLIGGVSILPHTDYPTPGEAAAARERKRHFSADDFSQNKRYRGFHGMLPAPMKPVQNLLGHHSSAVSSSNNSRSLTNSSNNPVTGQASVCSNNDSAIFVRPRPRHKSEHSFRNRCRTEPMSRIDGLVHVSATPTKGKRKQRPAPLVIPPSASNYAFQSRLRSPRLSGDCAAVLPPYTPPPMLSPMRRGAGLFNRLSGSGMLNGKALSHTWSSGFHTTSGALSSAGLLKSWRQSTSTEEDATAAASTKVTPPLQADPDTPPTDTKPHINVGPSYQAEIPELKARFPSEEADKDELIFSPQTVSSLTEDDLRLFEQLAVSAALPGNGVNVELAYHSLHLAQGSVSDAIQFMINGELQVSRSNGLHGFKYCESDSWTGEESKAFHEALIKHDKDFFAIAKEIETKSTAACVEMYYVWKKVHPDEHKRLRQVRRRKEQENMPNLRSRTAQTVQSSQTDTVTQSSEPSTYSSSSSAVAEVFTEEQTKKMECENSECSAVFTSRRALTVHMRNCRSSSTTEVVQSTDEFPCKNCGRVFFKVKSRNAHLRSCKSNGAL